MPYSLQILEQTSTPVPYFGLLPYDTYWFCWTLVLIVVSGCVNITLNSLAMAPQGNDSIP